MDWSKIKTIFIITFLVLDVYLLYQFMKIRDANKYELITEASFEDKLKADEIKYVDLPKTPIQDQYISAKPKTFTKEDIAKLKGQTASIKDSTTLKSSLDKPLQIDPQFGQSNLNSFVKENVLYGDRYKYWNENDKDNTVTYYEQYEGEIFYKNISGMITFYFDKDHQVYSYEQTYLEGIEKLTAKQDILPPLKAIETLHQKGLLKSKSKITKVDQGYATLIQLAASQVMAPTWHIVVNDKDSLYVNAFEGKIIDFNSEENKTLE